MIEQLAERIQFVQLRSHEFLKVVAGLRSSSNHPRI